MTVPTGAFALHPDVLGGGPLLPLVPGAAADAAAMAVLAVLAVALADDYTAVDRSHDGRDTAPGPRPAADRTT